LKDTLKETIDESMKLEGVSNVKVGEIKTIAINGHQGVYAPLSFNYYGLSNYDIYCMWYCDQSQRLYYIGIDSYNSEETNELFNVVIDSFVCHWERKTDAKKQNIVRTKVERKGRKRMLRMKVER